MFPKDCLGDKSATLPGKGDSNLETLKPSGFHSTLRGVSSQIGWNIGLPGCSNTSRTFEKHVLFFPTI